MVGYLVLFWQPSLVIANMPSDETHPPPGNELIMGTTSRFLLLLERLYRLKSKKELPYHGMEEFGAIWEIFVQYLLFRHEVKCTYLDGYWFHVPMRWTEILEEHSTRRTIWQLIKPILAYCRHIGNEWRYLPLLLTLPSQLHTAQVPTGDDNTDPWHLDLRLQVLRNRLGVSDVREHTKADKICGRRIIHFAIPLFQALYSLINCCLYICQNLEVGQGYGVTCRVHHRSFQVDKTRLQLMCCALIQEPGCLVISEGQSPECGTGFLEWT